MSKSIKSRILAVLSSLLVGSIVLTGCSSNKKGTSATVAKELEGRYMVDPNTPAWKLDKKENTKLKWYVNADWWNTNWGDDTVTKKLKKI